MNDKNELDIPKTIGDIIAEIHQNNLAQTSINDTNYTTAKELLAKVRKIDVQINDDRKARKKKVDEDFAIFTKGWDSIETGLAKRLDKYDEELREIKKDEIMKLVHGTIITREDIPHNWLLKGTTMKEIENDIPNLVGMLDKKPKVIKVETLDVVKDDNEIKEIEEVIEESKFKVNYEFTGTRAELTQVQIAVNKLGIAYARGEVADE